MCLVILDAASPKTTHTHIHTQTDKHVHTPRFTPYAFYRDWHLHLLVEATQHLLLSLKPINFWHRLRPSKFVTSACGALNSFQTEAAPAEAALVAAAATGVVVQGPFTMG